MIFAAYQNLLILFTTRPSTSPAADVSAPPQKINLSTVFVVQAVGIKEVEEGIGLVSFMDYDLGYIDLEEKTLQPLEPFWPKSVTYVSGTICNEAVKKPR